MTRPSPSAPEPALEVLALQRFLADLAMGPDPDRFARDPAAVAEAAGLPYPDQQALLRFKRRLLFYRDGVRQNLTDPLDRYLPLTQTLLEEAGAWEACCAAFLATRPLDSPYYRDIAPTFLGWLASSGWGRDRWPYLLQLAHFELIKELVETGPDGDMPEGLRTDPGPGDLLVPAAPTQVLSYGYRVHEASLRFPVPVAGPCHLLAFRGRDGYVKWKELSAASAALLALGRERPLGAAAADLGLDLPETLAFLRGLREEGVVLGFRGA